MKRLVLPLVFLVAHSVTLAATINFDTYPDNSPVPDDTIITTQYASVGVTFTSDAPEGAPRTYGHEASSPPNCLIGDLVNSAGLYKIVMDFAAPTNSLDVTLISVGDGIVKATALASDHTSVLDTVSVTHPGTGNGYGHHDPITLRGAGIARVEFEITQTSSEIDGYGIDDIVFPSTQSVPSLSWWGFTALTLAILSAASGYLLWSKQFIAANRSITA